MDRIEIQFQVGYRTYFKEYDVYYAPRYYKKDFLPTLYAEYGENENIVIVNIRRLQSGYRKGKKNKAS